MAENGQEKIVAFDTLFTTNQIQILKILLTYMEPAQQKNIAIYIKFLELQYTMKFFQNHPASLENFPKEESFDVINICEEVIPYCSPSEQEMLKQMKSMYQNFANMQEMMQMVQMMKDLFPEGDNPLNGDPTAMFSGLSGLTEIFGSANNSPNMDMSQIFDMFGNRNP